MACRANTDRSNSVVIRNGSSTPPVPSEPTHDTSHTTVTAAVVRAWTRWKVYVHASPGMFRRPIPATHGTPNPAHAASSSPAKIARAGVAVASAHTPATSARAVTGSRFSIQKNVGIFTNTRNGSPSGAKPTSGYGTCAAARASCAKSSGRNTGTAAPAGAAPAAPPRPSGTHINRDGPPAQVPNAHEPPDLAATAAADASPICSARAPAAPGDNV